jgi:hypothetical protein
MVTQNALFPEIEEMHTESEPRGFRYRDGIVTEEEQAALAESLSQLNLIPRAPRESTGGQFRAEI